jgi:hypothetical protein
MKLSASELQGYSNPFRGSHSISVCLSFILIGVLEKSQLVSRADDCFLKLLFDRMPGMRKLRMQREILSTSYGKFCHKKLLYNKSS